MHLRIAVPVIALLSLLAIGVSTPSTAGEVASAGDPQAPAKYESISWDYNAATSQALDQLYGYLATVTTTTTVVSRRQYVPANYDPGDGSRWDQLAQCESGGNWAYPPIAGGFSGGIMFHIGTWRANGGDEFAPDAFLATREQQIIVAERVLAASGWGAWPGCSKRFGWI